MKQKKLLIADDEVSILNVLELKFKKSGFSVITAQNGREALELIKKEKPNVVITDNKMPEMTGFELCRECKEIKKERDFLLIMLSSYASLTSMSEKKEIESIKDTIFVPKPFSPRYLLSVVMDYFSDEKKIEGSQI
ncbi:MAG: response regulator [Candidatus Schekmanbacteria bacterium]|nr:MAG: response regulator [Candidatus Schekmanbacteria bacterium]